MSTQDIKDALERHGEMSAVELQDATNYSRSVVFHKLKILIEAREAHISSYRNQVGVQGRRAALYSVGQQKPKEQSAATSARISLAAFGAWSRMAA